ncbi:selenide, water dikinase SelD [Microbulbifer yueqingensis]|uniref:Selenophosphate synthase n=1 Tax=Microbulbifer yueqingensis TaxID=658219 RepID=A0A1G8Y5Z6_9GAMM|nr:selenide, water dikinase SelD [Microbulbifer yueqingensis]SDJ98143.1 selenophosphate synthase [Microbulbifer yueqingensis]
MQQNPYYQDVVLVGGGHSHAIVLQMWAMNPLPGVRLTLVSPQVQTAYSGMLPGLVAGHYSLDETHIDLVRLCRAAGARFIRASARRIDPVNRRISLEGRPDLEYDLVSLDVGSGPVCELPGAEHAVPVKPISRFHHFWQELRERVRSTREQVRIGVVGGGAGGCELAMAIAWSLEEQLYSGRVEVHLVHGGKQVPEGYPPLARRLVARELQRLGIAVHRDWRVQEITAQGLRGEDDRTLALEEVVLCTHAGAHPWLADCGLALDARGFVRVDDKLRAEGFSNVFAAGDTASFVSSPLPKAGVYAVRQGPVLFHNLRASLTEQQLRSYRPQRHFLSLLSCGDKRAVASRNGAAVAGSALWHWKDRIDRKFMQRFAELPVDMDEARGTPFSFLPSRRPAAVRERGGAALARMRCNGCGAKVGADILHRALQQLPRQQSPVLLRGAGDDAAVMELPPGQLLVQSSDQLRAPVDDPWIFGRLATLHALSDLFAMHAQPATAQLLATLPVAAAELVQRDLQQLLDGAIFELNRHDCALSGGHTAEGTEMQLGLTVNGLADAGQLLEKTGAQVGDRLILAKPLGVGTILAAEGAGAAHPRWVQAAMDTMLQSNAEAARIFGHYGAHALTDITGFGLLGHLLEMLAGPPACGAVLVADQLPLIEGAPECADAGWLSSLHPQNARFYDRVQNPRDWQPLPHWALLADPQTCGGLLAAVPADRADDCLRELHRAGYSNAATIGAVTELAGEAPPIELQRSATSKRPALQKTEEAVDQA